MSGFVRASRLRESVADFGVGNEGVSRSRGKESSCDRSLSPMLSCCSGLSAELATYRTYHAASLE